MNALATPHVSATGEHRVLEPEVIPRHDGSLRNFTNTDTTALLAFSLALAAWFVLPIVGAIAALVILPGTRERIRSSNGSITGESLVTCTKFLAYLHLLLAVGLLVAITLGGIALIGAVV